MTRRYLALALLVLTLCIGCRQPAQPDSAPVTPPPVESAAPPAEEPQEPIKNARRPMEGLLTGGQITGNEQVMRMARQAGPSRISTGMPWEISAARVMLLMS